MNLFRKRKGIPKLHTVPAPAQPALDTPVDILPETVDQGVHRFVVTTEAGNVEAMYEAALFLSEALIDAARRSRRRQAVEQMAFMNSGQQNQPLPIAPMQEQWLCALDTLSATAVPIAFRSLQDLYRGSTRENWTATVQSCANALVNLIFFVLVTYRRLDLASRTGKHAPTPPLRLGGGVATVLASPEATATSAIRLQARLNEKTQRQLRTVSDNIKSSLSEYVSFMVWNAEEQVRHITELRIVSITGHPDFHELPSMSSYLSSHDCFIWLLVASVLHGDLPRSQLPGASPGSPSTAPAPGAAMTTRTGSGSAPSPMAGASDTPSNSSFTNDSHSHTRANASPPRHSSPGSHESVPLTAATAPGEQSSMPTGWLTQTLLVWNADGDGALFTQHFASVVLNCLNLYLKAWLQRRTHVFQLVDAWSVRDVVFPASSANVASLVRELTASDPPATEDISHMIQLVTEMIVHASFIFYGNPRCLVQLLYLLGPLSTVHFLCVVNATETAQSHATPSQGGDTAATVVEVWRSGVSKLMESFAEYVLEPGTAGGAEFSPTFVSAPPPEVSALLLQLTVIHIASESCTHAWVELGRGSVTALYTASATATRRQQLRTWSTWISAARATLFQQAGRSEHETLSGSALPPTKELLRLDVLFAQSLCLAFEDLYALAMAAQRRDVGSLLSHSCRRVLFTAFSRIKMFITRLHEEHALEVSKHDRPSTLAMQESSFNAVSEVLDKYMSALRVNAAAPATNHRSYWLLAVSYLRLSGLRVPGEEQLSVSLNYLCSTPGGSVKYLRDRSYECYEDWAVQHQGKSWVQDEHACNLERYAHELQPGDFVARDRLLYGAMRFLCVAVKAAREEQRLAAAATTPFHPAPLTGESQAETYLSAFTRFLLMLDTLSCSSLCAFLRQAHNMLITRDDADGATAASNSHVPTNPLDVEGRTTLLDSVAAHQARLFAIDTSLFFL